MNKKKLVVVALTVIVIAAIVVIYLCCFRNTKPKRVVDESKIFTKQEINDAMDLVEKEFKKEFKGCTLTMLSFDESYNENFGSEWKEQYDANQSIVLLSSFKVGSSGGDGSLNPNTTYDKWNWILTRDSKNELWTLRTWGY